MGTDILKIATRRLRSETGATFVFVGLSIAALMGLGAFVVDHGILMVARGQLQNAADAGALAGAVARAFDNPVAPFTVTTASATQTALANNAYDGGTLGVVVAPNAACPSYLGASATTCVRVDVHRDGSNGSSTLPVVLGPAMNISSQRARATATALAASANSSNCLKPWIIPDNWLETTGNPNTFETGDVYVAPSTTGPGTGWSVADIGQSVVLKPGNHSQRASPSFYYEIEDATTYEEAITGCVISKRIGDTVTSLPGGRVGPTRQGVETLTLDGTRPANVVIAMFSPVEFEAMRNPNGNFTLTIVNMMGLRIDRIESNGDVLGTIIGAPGDISPGAPGPTPGGAASMIRVIRLVR